MADMMKPVKTPEVEVKFSHLHKPDRGFGDGAPSHGVTVIVTPELDKLMKETLKASGSKKLNGVKQYEGVTILNVRTTTHTKKGIEKFPEIYDSAGKRTEVIPFSTDKVILKLFPNIVKKDKSLSLYLGAIQIVGKNSKGFSAFAPVEGGWVAEDKPETPEETEPATVSEEAGEPTTGDWVPN